MNSRCKSQTINDPADIRVNEIDEGIEKCELDA